MPHQLTRISNWRQKWFTPDSMPAVNTVKSWINKGVIDGEIIDGNYFIYSSDNSPLTSKPNDQALALVARYNNRLNGGH
jgi:hypothetical protein